RECERRERVLRVVASDERQELRLHDQLATAREPRAGAALDETPFLFRQRNTRAERLRRASRQPHEAHDRIVAIEHLYARAQEDARLRARVVGETGVA